MGNGLYFDRKVERNIEGALVPFNFDLAQTADSLSKISTGETGRKTEGNKEIKFINEKINFLKLAFCLKSSKELMDERRNHIEDLKILRTAC